MSAHAYLCHATFENVLISELQHLCASYKGKEKPQFSILTPGVVHQNKGPLLDPCFARQVLPDAKEIKCSHHEEWIQKLFAAFPQEIQNSQEDWSQRLHVFAPDQERKGSEPVPEHFFDHLADDTKESLTAKIGGRARKMKKKGGTSPAPFLIQILITGPHRGWVSHTPREEHIGTWTTPVKSWPSPFEAGRAPVVSDFHAPSSAHRKLQEALLWLNETFKTTDVVWDAGAAPGGWSYEALKQGAKVFAVDRGKMDPLLMENGRLTHLRKDAFTTEPPEPVTFLVCDIIELPHRVLTWLKDVAADQPLRAFAVTLKLKKPLDFSVLDDSAQWVREAFPTWEWRIKNLRNNKLEVTFMARCSEVK